MDLEFKVYELKENSMGHKSILEDKSKPNEFIIVGEEEIKGEQYYKVQHIDENGICLIGGLNLEESAYLTPKGDLKVKSPDGLGCEVYTYDIPKEYLTLDIVENIKRLNN